MSLIQEALKRQKEESNRDASEAEEPSSPTAPAEPAVPAVASIQPQGEPTQPVAEPLKPVAEPIPPAQPAPPEPAAPPPGMQPTTEPSDPPPPPPPQPKLKKKPGKAKHEKKPAKDAGKGRTVASLVGIVTLVLILVSGGAWLLIYAFQQLKANKQSTEIINHQIPQPEPKTESGGAPVSVAPDVDNSQASDAESTPASSSESQGDTGTEVAVSDDAPDDGVETATANDPAISPDAVSSDGGEEAAGKAEVEWPYLKISGVVGKGVLGAATINGRVVHVGESIEGVEVLQIGDYGVKLECQNEIRFVKVGNTVE